jgi:hypothetical protein
MYERYRDIKRLGLSEAATAVVVEHEDPEAIKEDLQEFFGIKNVEEFLTELDFRRGIARWIEKTPELFVIGCSFNWSFPEKIEPTKPSWIKQGSFYTAGERSIEVLNRVGILERTKVMFHCPLGTQSCTTDWLSHPNVTRAFSSDGYRGFGLYFEPFLGK